MESLCTDVIGHAYKDIVEMICRILFLKTCCLCSIRVQKKNGFKDNLKSYILVFGTTRLNTGFLLDFASKGSMICRIPNLSLKPERALEYCICTWNSRAEYCHLSPLLKWKMRNKTVLKFCVSKES